MANKHTSGNDGYNIKNSIGKTEREKELVELLNNTAGDPIVDYDANRKPNTLILVSKEGEEYEIRVDSIQEVNELVAIARKKLA